MSDTGEKVFFRNLDGLRALAFGMVFIYHFFGYIGYTPSSGAEEQIVNRLIFHGHLGVNLFFVLSGFLITYLLLREKERDAKINIPHFYMRRVLRIWPLYFATIALSFFIYPWLTGNGNATAVKEHLPWYLCFLNNFDRINNGFVGIGNDNAGVLWSIAVEEQFYLFWPLLLGLFRCKHLPWLFSTLIVGSLVYRTIHVNDEARLYLHSFSVMSDLIVGAFLAWLSLYSRGFRQALEKCPAWVIVLGHLGFFLLVFFIGEWEKRNAFTIVAERLILSLGFAFVIAIQCFARKPLVALGRFTWLRFTGVISYGLYCLHLYTFTLVQKINLSINQVPPAKWLFYTEFLLCLGLSVVLCYISYRYFESWFLRYKERFTTIRTREV